VFKNIKKPVAFKTLNTDGATNGAEIINRFLEANSENKVKDSF
jgi:hypothetical protein